MSRKTLVLTLLSTLFAALVVVVVLSLSHTGHQAQDTAKTAVRGNAQAKKTAAAAKTKTDKTAAGLKTIVREVHTQTRVLVQKGILRRGPQGLRGGPGPIGRTGARGRDAVFPFTLPDVVEGVSNKLTGRVPSPTEVAQACGESCVGPAGRDGADGKDAPPVTDAQLDATVDRHCAPLNGCVGATGATGGTGATGATGAPGPPPQPFTFTFTDGTGVTHTCTIDPNTGAAVVQACA